MDLTMVNLDDVLPQATIMVVSVTGSTTSGQPLSGENLTKVLEAAEAALQIDEDKGLILQLVQQKMHKIAPNLSAAVGTEIAARLMGVAGGLVSLSKMPACNVQVACYMRMSMLSSAHIAAVLAKQSLSATAVDNCGEQLMCVIGHKTWM